LVDFKELYRASLQFPSGYFGSPEFWQGLIVSNTVTAHIKAMGPENLGFLWKIIIRKTSRTKVFQSLLEEYIKANKKGEAQDEIINELLKEPISRTSSILPLKRLFSENLPKTPFKITTSLRFQKIDLSLLLSDNLSLDSKCKELDREGLMSIYAIEGYIKKIIEFYKEALLDNKK